MSFDVIVNLIVTLGFPVAAAGFGLATFIFLVWAFLGQRGDSRTRRLRIALSSVLLFVATFLSAASTIYFVTIPGTVRISRPDFRPPDELWSKIFAIIGPASIFLSVGLVIWALYLSRGTRKRVLLTSLCCFLLLLSVSAANYVLIYSVQVPAIERYVMIESRDWLTHVGEAAPDVEVVMVDGSQARLSEFRGKVVLLNFFATWCGPCLHELPHLQEMWNDLEADDDFLMLVIGRKESQESVAAFKSKKGYTFPMAVDPDSSAYSKFAEEGIPRTYLISRDGTILYQSIGFAEIDLYARELVKLRQIIDSELATTR